MEGELLKRYNFHGISRMLQQTVQEELLSLLAGKAIPSNTLRQAKFQFAGENEVEPEIEDAEELKSVATAEPAKPLAVASGS